MTIPSIFAAFAARAGRGKWACIVGLFCVATITSQAQTFQTLLNFDGANGEYIYAPLVQGLDGSLYGTTLGGGEGNFGTVFRLTLSGTLKRLYRFCILQNCADGAHPVAGLVLGTDGIFYGTTQDGGTSGDGTIFKVTPSGVFTTLHSFAGSDGSSPVGGLVQATDGSFYGTTEYGGASSTCADGCGVVYRITSDGSFTVLHSFNADEAYQSFAALIEGPNGTFYGTSAQGGTEGALGSAFKVTSEGEVTVLQSFCCTLGQSLFGPLMQAPNGTLFGTTFAGGTLSGGTIFKLSPEGRFATLFNFAAQGNSGSDPGNGLVLGTDGNLYGVTTYGYPSSGTIFKITLAGTLTTLHDFNGTDGDGPAGALLQATNGIFYGTTAFGGSSASCRSGCGTVFSIDVGLAPFVKTVPGFGIAGSNVKILGNDLTGATSVTFSGVAATFTVVSSTLIRATVPPGAISGNVQVTTSGGTLTSDTKFRVR